MQHKQDVQILLLLTLLFLLKGGQCQKCTSNFCDLVKVKCPGVTCEPNEIYHRRGGGLCGCCPICVPQPTIDGRCNPHFCDNIKVKCVAVECGPHEVALIKPELCRCCPNCYPIGTSPCE